MEQVDHQNKKNPEKYNDWFFIHTLFFLIINVIDNKQQRNLRVDWLR